MECTGKSITDICLDAGVESQRTFNRVSRERYKVTSREYRNFYREQHISQTQDETFAWMQDLRFKGEIGWHL